MTGHARASVTSDLVAGGGRGWREHVPEEEGQSRKQLEEGGGAGG
jgi:hypothetical protein